MKILAKIRYVGTDFHGFQVQPGKRTVQGELNRALDLAFGKPCRVTGCSRTDAGVHALAFCVTVECDGGTIPPEKLPVALIPYLPPDLSLYEARPVPDSFHPRYDVLKKTYLYRVVNRKVPDPFLKNRAWFLPRILPADAVDRMRLAAQKLVGRHDFSAFMAEGSDVTDTVRMVESFRIETDGDEIRFFVSADGFLYNMVRIMVGTLVEVGYGRFPTEAVSDMIASCDRKNAGMTAPADGLYLYDVVYDEKSFG